MSLDAHADELLACRPSDDLLAHTAKGARDAARLPHDVVTDPYAASAEFLAVMYAEIWPSLAPALERCLTGVDVEAGPVLDLGAGTGMGTSVILDAVPHSTVLAVEPSSAMRAALFARILNRADGAQRVTVLPNSSDDMTLPDSLGGMIGLNVVEHLSTTQRLRLWKDLTRRLPSGSPVVVNVQQSSGTQKSIPRTEGMSTTVGGLRYSVAVEVEPDGPESATWRLFYTADDGEQVVYASEAERHFVALSSDQLVAEFADAGFHAEVRDCGLLVARLPE